MYDVYSILYQIRGSLTSTEVGNKYSVFDLTISHTVYTKEYVYPEFSFPNFLSSFGGTLGLWLGVGVIQIGGFGSELLKTILDSYQRQ